jgi:predicted transcriptional regulator
VDVRDAVWAFVRENPGVHGREVERRLGLSSRLGAYHLDALLGAGRLRRFGDGRYARFVEASKEWDERELEAIAVLRRAIALRIALLILTVGPLQHKQLVGRLDLAKASVAYHLAALESAGLVRKSRDGRDVTYRAADEGMLRKLLPWVKPLPEELGLFQGMWEDLLRPARR